MPILEFGCHRPLVRLRGDRELVPGADGALSEQSLRHRDRHTQLRRSRVLVGEGVEKAEQAVADDERIEPVFDLLALTG